MQGRGRVGNNPPHPCPPSTEVENANCSDHNPTPWQALVTVEFMWAHVSTQHITARHSSSTCAASKTGTPV
jgi:hypothetical protein